jgi:hypothetical protein
MSRLFYQFKNIVNERPELLKDKVFADKWITSDWQTFQFFDRKIKNNDTLAFLAYMGNAKALTWVPKRLKRNREFVFNIVKTDPHGKAWTYIHFEFSDDDEIVSTLIGKNGLQLALASERIKENKELVLKAINHNPNALKFAGNKLKNDPEVVLRALTLGIDRGEAMRNSLFLIWRFAGQELKETCKEKTGNDLIQCLQSMVERQKLQTKYQIPKTTQPLAL